MSFSSGSVVEVGTVRFWGKWNATTPPDGWLFCDGSAISRTLYAELFDVLGTTYGAGDGSTTFNLPVTDGATMLKNNIVDIKGNGKTLGYTNGSINFGIGIQPGSGVNLANSLYYNTNIGSSATNLQSEVTGKTIGITTDASKSGVIGNTHNTQAYRMIIKY